MKKMIISAIAAWLMNISITAQEKIYFDENWEVTTKDKMVYYRETETKDKRILIRDYYTDGTLQMEGPAVDTTAGSEIFDGTVTWYSPEGKMVIQKSFVNGSEIGPSRSFDEKGRPIQEFFYKKDGTFTGKIYNYKDPEGSSSYNAVSFYDSPYSYKTIVYDEDIKGIRYEAESSDALEYFTKYYGENGKYIGKSSLGDDKDYWDVEYYYNPMVVSRVQKKNKNGELIEGVIYDRNGKILQEEKKNKKGGFKKTYDHNGKLIGNLSYKYDKESESLVPQDGDDYWFNSTFSGYISIDSYKNGAAVSVKYFDEDARLASEKFVEGFDTVKINYYSPDGTIKGVLNYREGQPYNGILYDELAEQQYQNGTVILSKTFTDKEQLKSESKINTENTLYHTSVYDHKGKVIYTYSKPAEESEFFTAKITQYVNGKQVSKAVIKDGVIESGKISYKVDGGSKELARQGDRILLKFYNKDGKLIQNTELFEENDRIDEWGGLNKITTEADLLREESEPID
ncbi:hypothetical protein VUJ46_01455 [Chryseobacterium sp. MYb264]|uniref:hypothetical protein n=1 Tax=Chryseobacterium sp. MYb264 TaxID=2745153 RepID=UPI002E149172|nr:hypothetical protein VUJ46_01455 [Chryseobacterium sp. MYb264]